MKSWKDNNMLLREAQPLPLRGKDISVDSIITHGRSHNWDYKDDAELRRTARLIRSMLINESENCEGQEYEYPNLMAALSHTNIEDLFCIFAAHEEAKFREHEEEEISDYMDYWNLDSEEEARERVYNQFQDELQSEAILLNRVCGCRITY